MVKVGKTQGQDAAQIRRDSKEAGDRARAHEAEQREAGNGVPPNNRSGVGNDTRVRPNRAEGTR